ncbi:putative leucine-rich repeat-containing protein DDB_G0290503 isoform X5 [Xenopus laevis]|uniref:Leucine-rich repeat-containing protein DDB_G0290503 isoform X5 n=1 Tax=Xenopus laevis TaxID=8355 RepID=A0A8J1LSU6_XENLA|nr:putative leucine-rich repeat-containing protein DDB_G0290503 isoform X5 [Xenopus laevis]
MSGNTSQQQIVGITSQCTKTELKCLMDLLIPNVSNVRYIPVRKDDVWKEEVDKCSLVILHHSTKHGRLNITDTQGSLYNEQLLYLSKNLGPSRVLVVLDDLEFTDEDEKKIILCSQPQIALCSSQLLLIPKNDKETAYFSNIDQIFEFLKGVEKVSEEISEDKAKVPSNLPSNRTQPVTGSVAEPSNRKNSKQSIPCSQKHSVSIFSRAAKSTYTWLMDLLQSEDFGSLVKEVHSVEISNNYSQFLSTINNCTFAILYHTLKFGRINITDVPDSIYDKELKDLFNSFGQEKIIVVIDDLLESNLEKTKGTIHQNQPSIGQYSQEAFFFSEREKKSGINKSKSMQDKITEIKQTIENSIKRHSLSSSTSQNSSDTEALPLRTDDQTPTQRQQESHIRRKELQPGTRERSKSEDEIEEKQSRGGGPQTKEGPNMGGSCRAKPAEGSRTEAEQIIIVAHDPEAEQRQQDFHNRKELQPGTGEQSKSEVRRKEMQNRDGGSQTTEGNTPRVLDKSTENQQSGIGWKYLKGVFGGLTRKTETPHLSIPAEMKTSHTNLKVTFFSRSLERNYLWLVTHLEEMKSICSVNISKNYSPLTSELADSTFAILYHNQKDGHLNITDVTDRELKELSSKLGKDNIIVIADVDKSHSGKEREILKLQPSIVRLACDLILFTEEEKKSSYNSETLNIKLERIETLIMKSAGKLGTESSNDTLKRQIKETSAGQSLNGLESNHKSSIKKINVNETNIEKEMQEGSSTTSNNLIHTELRVSENSGNEKLPKSLQNHGGQLQLENKINHYEGTGGDFECVKNMGDSLAEQQKEMVKAFKLYSEIQEKIVKESQQIQDVINDLQNTIIKQGQEIKLKDKKIKEQTQKIEEQDQKIEKLDQKIKEQDQKIVKLDQKIKEQKIEEQAQIKLEQDRLKNQDEKIKEQAKKTRKAR